MHNEIIVKFLPAKHWWQRSTWMLLKDYTSHNNEVTAVTGFITDGASIPWFARMLFSATGRYFGASIVHDYILKTTGDWDKANVQFEKELSALEIAAWRKSIIMSGVTIWAWFK